MRKLIFLFTAIFLIMFLTSCPNLLNKPPEKPHSPTPENGAENQPLDVNLTWECSDPDDDNLSYDIYYGKGKLDSVVLNLNENRYSLTNLEGNTEYLWQVVAEDEKGNSTESDVWSFTTITPNQPPSKPSNPFPENGAVDQPKEITLSWMCSDPDNDEILYDIYFGKESLVPVATDCKENEYTIGNLNGHTTYEWKIVAKDDKGNSIESDIWEFTTKNSDPIKPNNIEPTINATNTSTDTALSWNCSDPDGDSLVYDIYLGTTEYPPQIASDYPATSFVYSGLQENKTYYWKIKAKDSYDGKNTGPTWSFKTKQQLSNTLTLTTSPEIGLEVIINDIKYKSPKSMIFPKDEIVEVGITALQEFDKDVNISGIDTKYIFNSWQDNVSSSKRIIQLSSDTTYTAYMNETYKVEIDSEPINLNDFEDTNWYEKGTNKFIIAPNVTGYIFDHWEINGIFAGKSAENNVTINSPKKIIAVYKPEYYFLTTNTTNGTISKTPDQASYTYNTKVEMEAIPEECYKFVEWSGNLSGSDNPETLEMDEDKSVIAHFEEKAPKPTITFVEVPEDVCGTDEFVVKVEVTNASKVSFSLQKEEETIEPINVSKSGDIYKVIFEAPDLTENKIYDLVVNAENEDESNTKTTGVYILRTDDILPQISFMEFYKVTEWDATYTIIEFGACDEIAIDVNSLRFEVNEGEIEYELGDIGEYCLTNGQATWTFEDADCKELEVTMYVSDKCGNEASKTKIINNELTLTIKKLGEGLTEPDIGSYSRKSPWEQTLTATPIGKYEFKGWKLSNGENISATKTTITINEDITATAIFNLPEYEITVLASPAMGGTVGGGGLYELYSEVSVVATPSKYSDFIGWKENNELVSTSTVFTFVATENRELIANFNPPLTIDSTPLSGIPILVNGEEKTTPYSTTLNPGQSIEVIASPTLMLNLINEDEIDYAHFSDDDDASLTFIKWSDNTNNNTRTFDESNNGSYTIEYDVEYLMKTYTWPSQTYINRDATDVNFPEYGWYKYGTEITLRVPRDTFLKNDHEKKLKFNFWEINGIIEKDNRTTILNLVFDEPKFIGAVYNTCAGE